MLLRTDCASAVEVGRMQDAGVADVGPIDEMQGVPVKRAALALAWCCSRSCRFLQIAANQGERCAASPVPRADAGFVQRRCIVPVDPIASGGECQATLAAAPVRTKCLPLCPQGLVRGHELLVLRDGLCRAVSCSRCSCVGGARRARCIVRLQSTN